MINLSIPDTTQRLTPRIAVIGVGGAGGNAVNNMIQHNLEGVEFLVANTDAQALAGSRAEKTIQLGNRVTQGLGAGSRPEIGRAAAEEAMEEIVEYLDGSNMVFVTAGMGGGTGTGAAPVIACAAREQGMLTVGVVTKPFLFEGAHRMKVAEAGLKELQQYVDTLIVIPNQNLFRIANERTSFAEAFNMADEVLHQGVRGVTDLMVMPGLINLDFADIKTVMSEMGKAMMGTGEAEGERRAVEAAEAAISNPLLDDVSMKGAKGVLINITGGMDISLYEVDEAVNRIRDEVDPDANIIFGSTFDETLEGRIRMSVVATGIAAEDEVIQPRVQGANLHVVSNTGVGPAPAAAARGEARPATLSATERTAINAQGLFPQTHGTTGHAQPASAHMAVHGNAALNIDPAAEEAPAEAVFADADAAAEADAMDLTEAMRVETTPPSHAPSPAQPARADAPFIPPKPAEAPSRPAQAQPGARTAPDPFREAELLNAGPRAQDPAKRKPGSLFRRVTGLLGTDEASVTPGAPPAAQASPTTHAKPAAPKPAQPGPVAQPAPQPRLAIDLGHKKPLPRHEDEALEIPAFLRRQAN